jgi:acyl-CoA reductase-like NAD-dependent aldehyde dehydrogenase
MTNLAAPTRHHESLYIDGGWRRPAGTERITVTDSTDDSVLGSVPAGTAADVDAAMAAAAEAFPAWAERPAEERAALLGDIATGLKERRDELADLITRETGMPYGLSRAVQVGLPVRTFRTAAELATSLPAEERIGSSLVVREPVGVVAAITPWNYPLHQIAAKVALAMAAGCTVVLKPSEVAPLDAFVLAQVVDAVGVPAGVFNVVSGTGPAVGEPMVLDPRTDMVSFTGSGRAGSRIAELASAAITRVALELGGKSANLLLDDLDDEAFERAVRDGVGKAFLNSGQTCTALTRMVVPEDRRARAEEILVDEVTTSFQPGDPFVDGTRLGPLASIAQVDRVTGMIVDAIEEGAQVLVGGPGRPEGLGDGFYVQPTVFTGVTNEMAIARDEVFGPVLCLLTHTGDDDAVRIANDSPYGLSGAVSAADRDRAVAVARRLRTGQVEVNGGAYNPEAPFGGYKQSGYGREYGRYGLEEFLEVKSLPR